MNIEKQINIYHFYYYYVDSKTGDWIDHGLWDSPFISGVGYHYHDEEKGFWLRYKNML